jgi:hypothetical protein
MKKLCLVLAVLVILPGLLFAQFAVGATALYKSPILLGQPVDALNVNVNQVAMGADLRYKQSLFQAEGLVLYSTGTIDTLIAYVGAGAAFEIEKIVHLSLGAGPVFSYNLNSTPPLFVGVNAKLNADVSLFGPVSLGLTYIMSVNFRYDFKVLMNYGLFGVQILYWIEP